MNTFDPNTNLNFQSGGLPAEDVALDQLMAHLGKAEQSLATTAMLDRIAVASWNAPAVQREPDVLPFAAHSVGQGGTTALKGTPWFSPLRMAAAVAIIGTIAAGIIASRSGSNPASPAQPGDRVAQATKPVDPNDADLALIDALWAESSSEELWADASDVTTSTDISLDDLLGGGSTDSVQGGAM